MSSTGENNRRQNPEKSAPEAKTCQLTPTKGKKTLESGSKAAIPQMLKLDLVCTVVPPLRPRQPGGTNALVGTTPGAESEPGDCVVELLTPNQALCAIQH